MASASVIKAAAERRAADKKAFFEAQMSQHRVDVKPEPTDDASLFADIDFNCNPDMHIPPPPTTVHTSLGFQALGIPIKPPAAAAAPKRAAPSAAPKPKKQKLSPVVTPAGDVEGAGEEEDMADQEDTEEQDVIITTGKVPGIYRKLIRAIISWFINREYVEWLHLPEEEREQKKAPESYKKVPEKTVEVVKKYIESLIATLVNGAVTEAAIFNAPMITMEYVMDALNNAARDAATNRNNKSMCLK
jgi:hypothetical protein